MKTFTVTLGVTGATAILLATAAETFAVVGQTLEIQGTDLALSWPSPGGYQQYLIQARETLDPSAPWGVLADNYPANSTNRTTFVIPGVVTSGYAGLMSLGRAAYQHYETTTLMAVAKDGSGVAVPLTLYPPSLRETNTLYIFETNVTVLLSAESSLDGLTGPGPDGPGGLASSGFYRVFHIPDWDFTITNYTYDGPWFFPVDFGDYRDRVANIEVFLNGERTPYAEYMSYSYGGQTYWGVGIYFDRLTNASYQIQLATTLNLDRTIGDDTPFLVLSNRAATITVSNLVTYADWQDLIVGTNYTFKAKCVMTNVNWAIDIYDAWGWLINGQTGTSVDGAIEWTWDLRDSDGYPRDNLDNDPFFDPVLSFAPVPLPPSTNISIMPVNALDYPSVGAWLTAYQDRVKDPNKRPYYIEAMEAIRGAVATATGIPTDISVLRYGPDAGPDAETAQANRNQDWYELRAVLANAHVRNLYYQGHGSANTVGGAWDLRDSTGNLVRSEFGSNSTAYVSSYWWRDNLTKNKRAGAQPYRFVFLDGCQTALGDWPDAVGIGKVTNSLAYYQNPSLNKARTRPSAFVGFNTIVGGPDWGFLAPYKFFRTEWINEWATYNRGLFDSFVRARNNSNWVPEAQLWASLRVFGYQTLHLSDYNERGQWPTQ